MAMYVMSALGARASFGVMVGRCVGLFEKLAQFTLINYTCLAVYSELCHSLYTLHTSLHTHTLGVSSWAAFLVVAQSLRVRAESNFDAQIFLGPNSVLFQEFLVDGQHAHNLYLATKRVPRLPSSASLVW